MSRRISFPEEKLGFSPHRGTASRRPGGFTLLELLVATTVFMLMVVVLASISNQALKTWSRNENKSDLREAARTAVNLMGGELRQAVLPVNRADQSNLQFAVNPDHSIFWQAPIATDHSQGDLAIVGYFVRTNNGGVGQLCRLFINPNDSGYDIYTNPQGWFSDAVLENKAPATETSDLKGLFLENVPGMWVTAYTNTPTTGGTDSYDSRDNHRLPHRVEISLALMDKKGVLMVDGGVTPPNAQSYPNAAAYLDALPASLRPHVETATLNVGLQ